MLLKNCRVKDFLYKVKNSFNNMKYDLVVIGAGSGGLTAAIGGAKIGARVLLIEKELLGGDCTHYGCVPSKALIKFSQNNRAVGTKKALEHVQKTKKVIADHETKEELEKITNLHIQFGEPKFISKNVLELNSKNIEAKNFVIATGSTARIPEIDGIDKVEVLTHREIFKPREFKSLTVIGGGPIGAELAQAFCKLGVKVTIIETNDRILKREDKAAAELVMKIFEEDGIEIVTNAKIDKISHSNGKKIVHLGKKEIKSDEVLVAIGKKPNVKGLGLEKAGVEYTENGIKVNSRGRTTNRRIYAVGDVVEGPQFTHFANHQGKVALTNMIFKFPVKVDTKVFPKVTFTNPQIASIGITEEDATNQEIEFIKLYKKYSEIDRAITDNNSNGFFKILTDKKGFIIGATLVGEGSGELIGEIALAMKNKIKASSFSDTIHPYPTYGYGLRNTMDQFRAAGFNEKRKRLVKKIFGLNGK